MAESRSLIEFRARRLVQVMEHRLYHEDPADTRPVLVFGEKAADRPEVGVQFALRVAEMAALRDLREALE